MLFYANISPYNVKYVVRECLYFPLHSIRVNAMTHSRYAYPITHNKHMLTTKGLDMQTKTTVFALKTSMCCRGASGQFLEGGAGIFVKGRMR